MDLGLNFGDEDLECDEKSNTNTVGDRDLPYNVKICTSQWFEGALQDLEQEKSKDVDFDQRIKMEKFSADHHYHQQDYATASIKYKRLLDILISTSKINSALGLDVQESLSRCYIHLGLTDEGLKIAREMVKAASTEDESRQRQALYLLSFACEKAQNWAECIDTLEQLCDLLPQFPQVWHKLGDVYSHFMDGCETDKDSVVIKQLSSYIRAKLLFQSVMGTASDFLRDRNTVIIQQLALKIDQVPIMESKKVFASEFIQKEIENQALHIKDSSSDVEDQQTEEPVKGCDNKRTFLEKFCSWNSYCDR